MLRSEMFGPPAGEAKAFVRNEGQSCKYAECLVVLTILELGPNIRRSLPLQCVAVLGRSKLCVFALPVRVMETTEPSSSQALGLASP